MSSVLVRGMWMWRPNTSKCRSPGRWPMRQRRRQPGAQARRRRYHDCQQPPEHCPGSESSKARFNPGSGLSGRFFCFPQLDVVL